MRFINTSTFEICKGELSDFTHDGYAILSHRWMKNEVDYQEFPEHIYELQSKKDGDHPLQRIELSKIRGACRTARLENIKWMWVDTCCIDKTNNAELAEAINSMFQWYKQAKVCVTYLSDVQQLELDPHNEGVGVFRSADCGGSHPQPSVWFSRGWTLQELLAPKAMKFYDTSWKFLGTKQSLAPTLERITGINAAYLTGSDDFKNASIAAKMSWMARRETSKPEDIAYSMLGLLGINMAPIYGEGAEEAFMRLQHILLNKSYDESLFAWKMPIYSLRNPSQGRKAYGGLSLADNEWGLLAPSPKWFQGCGSIITDSNRFIARDDGGFIVNQKGIMAPFALSLKEERRNNKSENRDVTIYMLLSWTIVGLIPAYIFYKHKFRRDQAEYGARAHEFLLNAWEYDKDKRLKTVGIYISFSGAVRVRSQEYCLSDDRPGYEQYQVQFAQPGVERQD